MKNSKTHPTALVHDALVGKRCWYVSCGGAAGSTFELALGQKKSRAVPLTNSNHPDEFRRFEGEANLFVWCTWRLDEQAGPITSSDDVITQIEIGLRRLQGASIKNVLVSMPGWDLQLDFSNRLTLRVFCDHVPGDPSFDGNWELCLREKAVIIEAGSVCRVEQENKATQAQHTSR